MVKKRSSWWLSHHSQEISDDDVDKEKGEKDKDEEKKPKPEDVGSDEDTGKEKKKTKDKCVDQKNWTRPTPFGPETLMTYVTQEEYEGFCKSLTRLGRHLAVKHSSVEG